MLVLVEQTMRLWTDRLLITGWDFAQEIFTIKVTFVKPFSKFMGLQDFTTFGMKYLDERKKTSAVLKKKKFQESNLTKIREAVCET